MFATVQGEVRKVGPGRNPKYIDVAIVQRDSLMPSFLWAPADLPGLADVRLGSVVDCVVYVQARNSGQGKAYLNSQIKEVQVLAAA